MRLGKDHYLCCQWQRQMVDTLTAHSDLPAFTFHSAIRTMLPALRLNVTLKNKSIIQSSTSEYKLLEAGFFYDGFVLVCLLNVDAKCQMKKSSFLWIWGTGTKVWPSITGANDLKVRWMSKCSCVWWLYWFVRRRKKQTW